MIRRIGREERNGPEESEEEGELGELETEEEGGLQGV